MGVTRSARCLCSKASSLPKFLSSSNNPRRSFHNSSTHHARRRPAYPSIKAADMELINKRIDERARTESPAYTDAQKAALRQQYTPEQIEAIEAGEAAIDPRDLVTQGAARTDPWKFNYFDDLAHIHPVIDKPVRGAEPTRDPGIVPKTEDEMAGELATRFLERIQEIDQGDLESTGEEATNKAEDKITSLFLQAAHEPETLFHARDKEQLHNGATSLAPTLPKLDDSNVRYSAEGEDEDPHMVRLLQQTGWTKEAVRRLRVKDLVKHRVVNQTRMGKIQSIYYLTIAGNQNGLLGVGEGKATEDEDARRQARMAAIRNMKPIPRYEDRTIYGEVEGKVGAVEVTVSSRPPGFGVRCQHLIFEMARAAGISDLSARVPRSRNPMNTVKATFQALMSQRLPEDIARARGKKLVDVRKVYYVGKVY